MVRFIFYLILFIAFKVMASILYNKGVYKIIDLSHFNSLFSLYFSVSDVVILSGNISGKKEALIYVYCLRKFCGLRYDEIMLLIGVTSTRSVNYYISKFVSLINPLSKNFDSDFTAKFYDFKRFVDVFRPRMSAAQRMAKSRAKKKLQKNKGKK